MHIYFTNDYFIIFRNNTSYVTLRHSIYIAAVHLIQSIIDSGCQ